MEAYQWPYLQRKRIFPTQEVSSYELLNMGWGLEIMAVSIILVRNPMAVEVIGTRVKPALIILLSSYDVKLSSK